MNTLTLHAHSHTTWTLSHYMHTLTLHAHSHTKWTLSHYMHTLTLHEHSHTTCTLSHYMHTLTLHEHSHTDKLYIICLIRCLKFPLKDNIAHVRHEKIISALRILMISKSNQSYIPCEPLAPGTSQHDLSVSYNGEFCRDLVALERSQTLYLHLATCSMRELSHSQKQPLRVPLQHSKKEVSVKFHFKYQQTTLIK